MNPLRKVFHFAVAASILLLTPLWSQDAKNVTLVGNFGKGEGEAKSVFAAGSLVYYGIGNKLQIASFTNPASPQKVASVILSDVIEGIVRTSIASNQYLVVVGGPKMWLINVQNPTTPSVTATVNIGGVCEGVATSGTNAYVAGGDAGLRIFNIANPASPTQIAAIDSLRYCESVVISAPYAYIAAAGRSHILNITNPAAPVYAGRIPALAGGYHQYLNVRGGHAYICDFNSGVQVVNVTNPASPVNAAFLGTGFRTACIVFDGNFGYVANGDSGMRIIDVSNIAAPKHVKLHDTPGRAAFVSFGAITIGGSPAGHIYVADRGAGLRAVNVSNANTPVESGALGVLAAAPGTAFAAFFLNNKVYVAYGTEGLRIIDVSTPANPTLLGTYNSPGEARGVVAAGDFAYIADRDSGVQVVNVANPASPTRVRNIVTSRARGIAINGNLVYVATRDSGMVILNVANPANPVKVTSVKGLDGENVSADGNLAGVSLYSKLRFYNVTNPAQPIAGGDTPDLKVGNEGFVIKANYAYVPDGDSLRLFNLANIASPVQTGRVKTGGYGYNAAISGKYAYVSAEGAGLRAIDISNPALPTEAGYYDGASNARWVAANEAYIYVAELTDGLTIYRNDLATAVDEKQSASPQQFVLHQNYPNPFWSGATSRSAGNPNTSIRFELAKPAFVTLEVKNVLGQTVATLVNTYKAAGSHVVEFDASQLVSGVYWYRLKAGGVQQTRKMLLMR